MHKDRDFYIEQIIESVHAIKRELSAWHTGGGAAACGGRDRPAITAAQWGALAAVSKSGRMNIGELAKALGVSHSAATQLSDELVQKGYLVRLESAADRRVQTLELTDRTKRHIGRMRAGIASYFAQVFAVLSDDELASFAALSKKIAHKNARGPKL
ncbi:MAG: MarR family transcriptional regulator [Candidatus Chaera renei]|uniref:MarR family transcriptional regulator n=1 Tax=Candidatus Chaera renei TaxID=2506947 RepID=A0A4Q0ALJ1_9BACT|nr:MAG: MarR family transcriptional regulator [Candidatus Chaera renei]